MAENTETWKPVPGYPGYDISDQARMRSYWARISMGWRKGCYKVLKEHPQLVLKPSPIGGRLTYCLWKDGKGTTRQAGYWMLLAFVGPRPMGMECCHNDNSFLNNNLSNLRWDTRQANRIDRSTHGDTLNILCVADIPVIRDRIKKGELLKDIAADYGVSRQTITNIKTHHRWAHVL